MASIMSMSAPREARDGRGEGAARSLCLPDIVDSNRLGMMPEAFIRDAIRTPIGRLCGGVGQRISMLLERV